MKKQFVATVYIVAMVDGEAKLLLHKHTKLGLWLGMGGHGEEGENMYETALREGREETRLDLRFINTNQQISNFQLSNKNSLKQRELIKTEWVEEVPLPYIILEEKIPAYKDQAEHIHIDSIYFAMTEHPELVKMERGEEYGWFGAKDLKADHIPPEVRIIGKEALATYKKLFS